MAPALRSPGARLAAGIAALAVVIYAGALANGFAWDDVPLIADNTLVHHASGLWRAFGTSYWPPAIGGYLYRPLVIASYALDWLVAQGGAWWFHGVNIAWHAGASVAVALMGRRWAGDAAGWIAGAVFAVHPVHVEAVANVIGRADLATTVCSLLAVWFAVERDNLAGSAVALALGLLVKETAAVVPVLIGAAWALGLQRPPARRIATYVAVWCVLGVTYVLVRKALFGSYLVVSGVAVVFVNQSPLTARLTAVAALTDVVRLLVFPLTLRVDYAPNERTAAAGFGDAHVLAGLACFAVWAALVWVLWRRQRPCEAWGIAWIGIAFAPVANLFFLAGVLVAERTLYLPSAGLALAAGAWLGRWWTGAGIRGRQVVVTAVAAAVLAGGVRTALRVPVWKSTDTVYQSIVRDSPRSYVVPMIGGVFAERDGRHAEALEGYRRAAQIVPTDNRLSLRAAEMAYHIGRYALADTLLAHIDSTCIHCETFFQAAAVDARARGLTVEADSLLRHLAALKGSRRP